MKNLLLILVVLVSFSLAACGAAETSQNPPSTVPVPASQVASVPDGYAGKTNPLGPDAAQAGAALFNNYCSTCHGPQGHGDGPAGATLNPAPKNLPGLAATVGDDYLFWRISTGKEGTAMVAWKGVLTDEDIWKLITFIRTLK